MSLKSILSTTVLALGLTCLSISVKADYASERLYMERELNRICTTSIGASFGSASYFECRDYYDRKFYDYGLDWDRLTVLEVRAFLDRTAPVITRCRNRGLLSTLLWGCIRDYEDHYYMDWHKRNPHFKPKHDYKPHFKKPEPPHAGPAPHVAPAPHHAGPAPHVAPKPHAVPAPHINHAAAPQAAPAPRREVVGHPAQPPVMKTPDKRPQSIKPQDHPTAPKMGGKMEPKMEAPRKMDLKPSEPKMEAPRKMEPDHRSDVLRRDDKGRRH